MKKSIVASMMLTLLLIGVSPAFGQEKGDCIDEVAYMELDPTIGKDTVTARINDWLRGRAGWEFVTATTMTINRATLLPQSQAERDVLMLCFKKTTCE